MTPNPYTACLAAIDAAPAVEEPERADEREWRDVLGYLAAEVGEREQG